VAAGVAEIVRLYGLRQWVEQSYKQTKYALGWHEYQVRSDRAIRRHWALVCCAFSFCWYHLGQQHAALTPAAGPAASCPAPTARGRRLPRPRPPLGRRGGGKIRGALAPGRPLLCWPVALRAVRAWLEPWIMLWRYWRGWSSAPPPGPVCALLDQLWHGHGIYLYVHPPPLSTKYRYPQRRVHRNPSPRATTSDCGWMADHEPTAVDGAATLYGKVT